jgi:hypothetical protein
MLSICIYRTSLGGEKEDFAGINDESAATIPVSSTEQAGAFRKLTPGTRQQNDARTRIGSSR